MKKKKIIVMGFTAGVPIAGQMVTFNESPATSLSFFPGGSSATTNAKGVATVAVQRVNQTTFGSGSFYATAGTYSSTNTSSSTTTSTSTSSTSVLIVSSYLTFRADPPVFAVNLLDANNAVTTSVANTVANPPTTPPAALITPPPVVTPTTTTTTSTPTTTTTTTPTTPLDPTTISTSGGK